MSERSDRFRQGFMGALGLPPGPDPVTQPALHRAWHEETVAGPVRSSQFHAQVDAARAHIDAARFHRVVGNHDLARRSLKSAGVERSIAARMAR